MPPIPNIYEDFLNSDFTGTAEEREYFAEFVCPREGSLFAELRSAVSPARPHPTESDWLEIRQQYRLDLEAERGTLKDGVKLEYFRGDLLGVAAVKRMLAASVIEIWRFDSLGTLWFKVVRPDDAE